jgi:hypothetical protein
LATAAPASAAATTIDFSAEAAGTVVSNQFSGLTFSLSGGPSAATAPVVGYGFFDSVLSLNNSGVFGLNTDGYPTGSTITIDFAAPTSGVSFTFNNYGNGNGSTVLYYDAGNTLLGSQLIDNVNAFGLISVAGSGISRLEITNGTFGEGNWIYGIGQLTYGAVPEPASWAMLVAGFGLIGATMRRRQTRVTA